MMMISRPSRRLAVLRLSSSRRRRHVTVAACFGADGACVGRQDQSPNAVAMAEEGISGIVLCGYLYKALCRNVTSVPCHPRNRAGAAAALVLTVASLVCSRARSWRANGIAAGLPSPRRASACSPSVWCPIPPAFHGRPSLCIMPQSSLRLGARAAAVECRFRCTCV